MTDCFVLLYNEQGSELCMGFFFFYAFQHCNLEAINDCAAFSVSYLAGDKMVKKKRSFTQISLKMTQ